MKVIGITGGVGAGKSALLQYIKEKYCCKILMADEIAHKVKEPGQACYEEIVSLLSPEILEEDGTIHRGKMAVKIFGSEELLQKVNNLIHPAVKKMILDEITVAKAEGKLDFLFVEAALLIEDGYLDIVDEMWYIYAREEVRRRRLKESRNYTDEKIDAIMKSQLKEEIFRKYCSIVIDNSEGLPAAFRQIDRKLGEYL
ncbi:MAG: dephospho-CoA kinase [Lachnospiraceae bacterium]|nr:dephospho-CoA kinase [Lachnospiraceae bacterium]GFI03458.1 dephospho-CoA kinase [Lachnospiraceae bacterium]